MKILGISFIVFGLLWAVVGFLSAMTDIQLGLAVVEMGMR